MFMTLTRLYIELASLLCLAVASLVALVLWLIMIVRSAISSDLTKTKKALWILGMVLFLPIAFIYGIFAEKGCVLRVLTIMTVIAIVVPLMLSPTLREIAFSSDRQATLAAMKADAELSSADFCAACISLDPQKNANCLEHVSRHLDLFHDDIAAHRVYCANPALTPEAANEQIVAWCRKVGPNFAFPEPRWKTMDMALSEKYPCRAADGRTPVTVRFLLGCENLTLDTRCRGRLSTQSRRSLPSIAMPARARRTNPLAGGEQASRSAQFRRGDAL
jgi:hypothetical protein